MLALIIGSHTREPRSSPSGGVQPFSPSHQILNESRTEEALSIAFERFQ